MRSSPQLINADGSLRNELLSWVRTDTPSSYRTDLFNTVDMLALHLLLLSTVVWHFDANGATYLSLRALAALALWVRLLRLIYLSESLGPLVLLLFTMTR